MGEIITLAARDEHLFEAYVAWPSGGPSRGGLVVMQEVFGVNGHIRALVDRFAHEGYVTIAPAVFDRLERGVSLDYGAEDLARGRALRLALGWEKPFLEIEAAREYVAAEGGERTVGVVGFCWGGSLAWLSACRLPFQAAVCYYGGQIAQFLDEHPFCPVMMHFGRDDSIIPPADQDAIMAAHPEVTYHLYAAGHGFNCDRREDFRPDCAQEAWSRTTAFLAGHLVRA